MAEKKKKRPATTAKRKGSALKAKSRPTPRKKVIKKKTVDTPQAVLNAEKLKELYATMVKCRMLAERVQRYERASNAASGLEATLVGAGAHLLPQDCVMLENGGFIASLIKGTSLHSIVAGIHRSHTNNGAGSLPADEMNAATPSMAMGLSLSREMKGKGAVTLMFGTQEPGAYGSEAMAAAATEKLPFVCLVESSFDSQAESHILPVPSTSHEAGSAYYPKITVDGEDVVAVFRVTQEAIRRAREGHGPAVIECMTSRKNAADKNGGSKASLHTVQDPLEFMEKYLKRRKLWSAGWSRKIAKEFTKQLDDAFAAGPENFQPNEAFDNVYTAGISSTPHLAKAVQ